jgi:hypothetical protein
MVRPHGAATLANLRRNAGADPGRARRWRPARDALWEMLDDCVGDGARVGVVGAGNGDDVPLTRLAARCDSLELLDLDSGASRRAVRREAPPLRGRLNVARADVTDGAADRIVQAALDGAEPERPLAPESPLPGAPYDVLVGDLLYSQLLYPGLLDAGLAQDAIGDCLQRFGQPLTDSVVARLHASAPNGVVLHVHDPLAWWDGHEQPVTLDEILAAPDAEHALALAALGHPPTGCEPRLSLAALGLEPRGTRLWQWPFQAGVDYLVCATLA